MPLTELYNKINEVLERVRSHHPGVTLYAIVNHAVCEHTGHPCRHKPGFVVTVKSTSIVAANDMRGAAQHVGHQHGVATGEPVAVKVVHL